MENVMKPLLRAASGREDLAMVYLLQLGEDPAHLVETVDSVDPRYPRSEKAVMIISTQFGCPVGCLMCDAAGDYRGSLTAEQMLAQVQFVAQRRPESLRSRKLKVHFARMGEPALNPAVLDALEELPGLLSSGGLIPCISTVAPAGCEIFFAHLLQIKRRLYPPGHFQLQISVNTTDADLRRRLIPWPTLEPSAIARLAAPFAGPGDRKVALNFALGRGFPVDPQRLRATFDPTRFMVKLTPVNPTARAKRHGLETVVMAGRPDAADELLTSLGDAGFDTVLSIGDADEIAIGSNCGQLVRALQGARLKPDGRRDRSVASAVLART